MWALSKPALLGCLAGFDNSIICLLLCDCSDALQESFSTI